MIECCEALEDAADHHNHSRKRVGQTVWREHVTSWPFTVDVPNLSAPASWRAPASPTPTASRGKNFRIEKPRPSHAGPTSGAPASRYRGFVSPTCSRSTSVVACLRVSPTVGSCAPEFRRIWCSSNQLGYDRSQHTAPPRALPSAAATRRAPLTRACSARGQTPHMPLGAVCGSARRRPRLLTSHGRLLHVCRSDTSMRRPTLLAILAAQGPSPPRVSASTSSWREARLTGCGCARWRSRLAYRTATGLRCSTSTSFMAATSRTSYPHPLALSRLWSCGSIRATRLSSDR